MSRGGISPPTREQAMNARIVRFHETGGPEVLKLETVDVPAPAAGEVRITVKALGLKPVIAKTFRLNEIVEAHRYLESNQQIGKIVVTV
jgi:NADPH:quinone reductase-like Zn-dependent oxidoreductase